jgi:sulfur-carrier protein adenylyltransferase/sulfurtransferase
MFSLSSEPINHSKLHEFMANDKAGAIVVFEGWVRDHNEGKRVSSLEYQIYHELALKEGEKILKEAIQKFNLHAIKAIHREGHLQLGDCAIWIGATASHRDDAFKATRFVIDEIKYRLPVWKKEHYVDHDAQWVYCKHHSHHVHFTESEYYSKQATITNQDKLNQSHVVVVGAGGLGCPALISLAQAGIGKITIIDFDKINISNIHRQSLYSPNLVGEYKVIEAKKRLLELNPFLDIHIVCGQVKIEHLASDLVLDCTDNMSTKYFLHDACFKLKIPLISAGIYKDEGQVRTFKNHGCLRCFNEVTPDDSLLGNCNNFGVLGSSVNILGSIQASEAIHYLVHSQNSTLSHTLYMNFNNLTQFKVLNSIKPDCLVCKGEVLIEENAVEVTGGMDIVDIRHLSDEEVLEMNLSKVALCCHKGIRSKKLALLLRNKGHEVFSLKGGACSL